MSDQCASYRVHLQKHGYTYSSRAERVTTCNGYRTRTLYTVYVVTLVSPDGKTSQHQGRDRLYVAYRAACEATVGLPYDPWKEQASAMPSLF